MADVAAAQSGSLYEPLPAMRRARRLGLVAVVVAIGLAFGQHPAPAFAGRGLGVSLSVAVLAGSAIALARSAEANVIAVALTGMISASAALLWLQPGGAGDAGLFVAVAIAGIRLSNRQASAAWLLAAAACIPGAVHAHHAVGRLVATQLGIAAFYLVARFGRSAAEAHAQARQLLAELQASRDAEAEAAMLRERSRLARDMHDVLAHSLSGLMLQLEGARMLAAQSDANGQLPPALDRAHHLARAGLDEARRAIAALRDEELPGANRLEQLTANFEHDSHIPTSLTFDGAPRPLDSETSLTIYRVAQEALTNIRKHSSPLRVELQLRYDPDGIRFTVRDHAERSEPSQDLSRLGGGGYGLTGMRERAALLGGTLKAASTDDGFHVELWIPS
jgi:signal transduction histidine kinase